MTPEERQEILDLAREGMSVRAIARRLGRNVKTIRRLLDRPAARPSPSKLARFKSKIAELVAIGLAAPRILREIRALGYAGGLTILKALLRSLRGPRKADRRVVRRFETMIGVESQIDWSPYRVPIGGVETVVNCFSMVVCWSRRQFVAFYRDQRLPTLLWAHVEAFRYLGGFTEFLRYDNQTTVTLGRSLRGEPLWNPRFLEFAKHYGFKPRVIRPKHKERQGKVERPFRYIESDFVKGRMFASWDDLHRQAREWLDGVANVRKHTTTNRFVHEAFAEERPLLIKPPELEFPTDRRESRKVAVDATVAIDGSLYPVPAHLIGQDVVARVYPHHVEILDAAGAVAVTHRVPDRPMRLPADWGPPQSEPVPRLAMESHFLARFPHAEAFLDGLKRRMTTLTPIHLNQIRRLVDIYGEPSVRAAIERATLYGNFNALALRRILEKAHPNIVPPLPIEPLTAGPAAMGALDDVDPGSPSQYTMDTMPPTEEPHEQA